MDVVDVVSDGKRRVLQIIGLVTPPLSVISGLALS